MQQRLARAHAEQRAVRIRRWIPNSDVIDGFVVAVGPEWVTVAGVDNLRLDGWHALRIKDVQAVSIDPDDACVEIRVLRARSQWPPVDPGVDLTDARQVLRSATGLARIVGIQLEFDRPDICWEGKVLGIDGDTVRLLEVDLDAEWARKPRLIDLEDITRVDFGGDYESALDLVAGPVPSA